MRRGKLPEQIKAAWGWYDRADWRGYFSLLAQSGHNMALRKAGIDGPSTWGEPSTWPQWANDRCTYLQQLGIDPVMFVYTWLGKQYGRDAEVNAILRLCQVFRPNRIVLNYEVETDGMMDSEAAGFIIALDTALVATYGDQAPAIDNSSVPSWDGGEYGGSKYHDVPYEAVSKLTVVDWYQNYWDDTDVTGGYDWEDGYQQKRGIQHPDKIVVPSWIVGKDPGVFAEWANSKGYAGIAGWEAGNAGYDFAKVAQAWPHLTNRLDLVSQVAPDESAAKLWNEFTNDKAFNPRVLGQPLYEGDLDLSWLIKGVTKAHYLKTEKGTLWIASGMDRPDYMHDGQFATIEQHNREQNLLAVRYGEGAYNLPPSH